MSSLMLEFFKEMPGSVASGTPCSKSMDVEHRARYTSISESCFDVTQWSKEGFNEVKCEGVEGFRLVLDNKKLVAPMKTLNKCLQNYFILLQ